MKKRDDVYISQIQQRISRIREYLKGVSREKFLNSESSFNLKVKNRKVRARNYARGPLQITDETRRVLADEDGELKDHYLTLSADDVKQIELALPAAIRWLFHKRELASKHLGKQATWEEPVAEYKGYLRGKKDYRVQKGMKNFISTVEKLNEKKGHSK